MLGCRLPKALVFRFTSGLTPAMEEAKDRQVSIEMGRGIEEANDRQLQLALE